MKNYVLLITNERARCFQTGGEIKFNKIYYSQRDKFCLFPAVYIKFVSENKRYVP